MHVKFLETLDWSILIAYFLIFDSYWYMGKF